MRSLERQKPNPVTVGSKKKEYKEVKLLDWSTLPHVNALTDDWHKEIPTKGSKQKNYWKSSTKYKRYPQRAKRTNDTGWIQEIRNKRKNSKPIPKGVIVHADGSWDFEDF